MRQPLTKRPARPRRLPAARRKAAVATRARQAVGRAVSPADASQRVSWDVDHAVSRLASATPIEMVTIEREGVPGSFIKDLARRLAMPTSRMFEVLGIAKATGEKKASAGERVTGAGGQAAIGVTKLLAIAEAIVADSTAAPAKGFDAAKWLGQWLERPQPALGGRRPAELLDTPSGLSAVARLLGAIQSGAYQ